MWRASLPPAPHAPPPPPPRSRPTLPPSPHLPPQPPPPPPTHLNTLRTPTAVDAHEQWTPSLPTWPQLSVSAPVVSSLLCRASVRWMESSCLTQSERPPTVPRSRAERRRGLKRWRSGWGPSLKAGGGVQKVHGRCPEQCPGTAEWGGGWRC